MLDQERRKYSGLAQELPAAGMYGCYGFAGPAGYSQTTRFLWFTDKPTLCGYLHYYARAQEAEIIDPDTGFTKSMYNKWCVQLNQVIDEYLRTGLSATSQREKVSQVFGDAGESLEWIGRYKDLCASDDSYDWEARAKVRNEDSIGEDEWELFALEVSGFAYGADHDDW